jgi:hypothetical protein
MALKLHLIRTTAVENKLLTDLTGYIRDRIPRMAIEEVSCDETAVLEENDDSNICELSIALQKAAFKGTDPDLQRICEPHGDYLELISRVKKYVNQNPSRKNNSALFQQCEEQIWEFWSWEIDDYKERIGIKDQEKQVVLLVNNKMASWFCAPLGKDMYFVNIAHLAQCMSYVDNEEPRTDLLIDAMAHTTIDSLVVNKRLAEYWAENNGRGRLDGLGNYLKEKIYHAPKSLGCLFDFVGNKEELKLKIRSGHICNSCYMSLEKAADVSFISGVNTFLSSVSADISSKDFSWYIKDVEEKVNEIEFHVKADKSFCVFFPKLNHIINLTKRKKLFFDFLNFTTNRRSLCENKITIKDLMVPSKVNRFVQQIGEFAINYGFEYKGCKRESNRTDINVILKKELGDLASYFHIPSNEVNDTILKENEFTSIKLVIFENGTEPATKQFIG